MNNLSTRLLFSLAVILLSSFAVQPVKKDPPLPTELRSEVLLVLLYDEVPIPDETKGLIRSHFRKHNELVEQANNAYKEACKVYPYPSAMITRSQYHKKEDVPEHRFILDSSLMEAFNNMENTRAGMNAYYVADIELFDRVTGTKHVILDDRSVNYHIQEGHLALKQIVKLLDKGE